jgi:hypothetical protein
MDFKNYEDYKQYVKEQWQDGFINELEQAGLIIESKNTGSEVDYRILSEIEYQTLIKVIE